MTVRKGPREIEEEKNLRRVDIKILEDGFGGIRSLHVIGFYY